ncbi:MAG TPA: hypothetical protein DHM44_00995 [Flexistipes sinusarabici]|uniref:NHL repeat containing protein n=1 Tax=Flexistipes sinusarabici TaxID=2352 RepID=A0A3D5Q9A4_FLESI|nr:hypothetical protein [Flexistipes sinusarabici]
MKLFLQIILMALLSLNVYAAQIKAELVNTYEFGEKQAPADVVLNFSGEKIIGIYNAYSGNYLTYSNETLLNRHGSELLKGGNCFVRSGGFYYFCNNRRNSVDIFNGNFEIINSIKLPAKLKGEFDPTDLTVLGNKIYIADNDNHRIVAYSIKDESFSTIGKFGENRIEFWYPYSITAGSKGTLFISEVLGTRVQKINPPDDFNGFIGGWGVKAGEFYRPTGIALYNNQHLFVADGYTGLIQVMSKDGDFEGVLLDGKGQKLKFGSPTHIRIFGDTLGVVDAWEKKVYIYKVKVLN